VKRGEKVFQQTCSVCHSSDTEEVIVGPSLAKLFTKPPAILSNGKPLPRTDAAIRELLVQGTKDMPPVGRYLSEQQTADLLAFLHTL
jgi:mono/diheme cytochrome c family protein